MEILKVFSDNTKKRRKNLNMSQEQLAEASGLHQTYISDLERGLKNPSLKTMVKIANTLDTTVPELLEEQ